MAEKRIVVAGAGPAGMMAAIRAGELRHDVTLIEKNPIPGKKLLLSGKGRCNLTNSCTLDLFLARFSGHGGQFLRDAFREFFNTELVRFFENRGLGLKTERQLRVFPRTDKAGSITGVLKKELERNKVKVIYRAALKDIILADKRIKGVLLDSGRPLACERLILATGGVSYGFTGSTGEGLEIARRLGHHIVALRPGLVPLETRQRYPGLKGLTLKNIRIKFSDGKKEIDSGMGELLFTHFGISGPLVLSLSGRITDWLKSGACVHAEIDLKPGLSSQQLEARLFREFKGNPRRSIRKIMANLLPQSLATVLLKTAGIAPEKQASQIRQEERRSIVSLLKAMRLDITGSRPIEEAMVTRGGVSLKEINPRTMESRLIKGLYFAGEMIDLDADTGGFNLQAAFSTGRLAGTSASLT